jgi:hypothetical protein
MRRCKTCWCTRMTAKACHTITARLPRDGHTLVLHFLWHFFALPLFSYLTGNPFFRQPFCGMWVIPPLTTEGDEAASPVGVACLGEWVTSGSRARWVLSRDQVWAAIDAGCLICNFMERLLVINKTGRHIGPFYSGNTVFWFPLAWKSFYFSFLRVRL